MIMCRIFLLYFFTVVALSLINVIESFESSRTYKIVRRKIERERLCNLSMHFYEDGHGDGIFSRSSPESFDSNNLFMERFKRRLHDVQSHKLKKKFVLPPNPFLEPVGFVKEILSALRYSPSSNEGFRILMRSSTEEFHKTLYKAVSAPLETSEDKVASALLRAVSSSNNQFGILVGYESVRCDLEDFESIFPMDPLDYGDGTCWVECQLRNKGNENKLLVATGWSLQKRSSDGAWLINSIDWQDFRDKFRPGIGREEWDRSYG